MGADFIQGLLRCAVRLKPTLSGPCQWLLLQSNPCSILLFIDLLIYLSIFALFGPFWLAGLFLFVCLFNVLLFWGRVLPGSIRYLPALCESFEDS